MDVYIRVSRLGDRDEEESTEAYEAQCRAWADRNNVDVDLVVEDTDVSGSVAVADRQLERLVQRVESGESEGIITPYIDRFGRDLIEGALALKRIVEAGGKLVAVREGFDSTDPGSQLTFNLRMSIAQDYLNRVRESWQTANDRAVDAGVWLAPRVPFGYRKDERRRLVVADEEARVVREVFKRRAGGENFSALTRWMRARCEKLGLSRGATISRTGLRRLIANRVYVGEVTISWGRSDNPRVIEHRHEAILSEVEWEAAQIEHPFSPRNGQASDAKLRGLVYCDSCGRRCKVGASGPPGKRKTNYSCTSDGCSSRASILTAKLDDHVDGLLMQAIAEHEPHVEAVFLGDTRFREAMVAVEEAKAALAAYRDNVEIQRTLGIESFTEGLRLRKEELRLARAELARARPSAQERERIAASVPWEEASRELDRQRFRQYVERVVLRPSGGKHLPPAERADVYWVGADEPYAPEYAVSGGETPV